MVSHAIFNTHVNTSNDNMFLHPQPDHSRPLTPSKSPSSSDDDIVHTPLPAALPVNCPANHMHAWNETKLSREANPSPGGMMQTPDALEMEYSANYGIKLYMVNGVIYRYVKK